MKLHEQVAALKENNSEVLKDVQSFLEYVNSPKFTGIESDGGRKDWISTCEVNRFLIDLRSKLNLENII
jgi:hypothetical protein